MAEKFMSLAMRMFTLLLEAKADNQMLSSMTSSHALLLKKIQQGHAATATSTPL
jgi:hypothetical protein